MYNVNFLKQLEKARRDLLGNSGELPDAEAIAQYSPPRGVETIPCIKDINGEWVPIRSFAIGEVARRVQDALEQCGIKTSVSPIGENLSVFVLDCTALERVGSEIDGWLRRWECTDVQYDLSFMHDGPAESTAEQLY